MKNQFAISLVGLALFGVILGCSLPNPFSGVESGRDESGNSSGDKTLTDKAVDTTVGESKIGVPECDEAMDAVTRELNSEDDNVATKALKATWLNQIRDGIRESVEKNKTKPEDLAKICREFKKQFDKYKAEEEKEKAKKKQQNQP